ncbi:putative peptidase S10, serine carboxypeptidase, alpha/Beta hydrolase [Rosa chinensis]|uniref:Putative peptidase S10, serine carboxypeptidase, alpha/Beta hydrolase n=1 Tax=Rosa chinensis TaxID=74649 RepID=A0A2P6QS85_ROSCH|nr:serine carboxypeptidase-like 13 [Rosa chinensis]PRQ37046.1 putative peptidase S10, serine carboxypeptidase, alpha/Beta hydrolase [Rosa chinensis]
MPTMTKLMGMRLLLAFVFTLILASTSSANVTTTTITTLPGYSGDLPFSFETGYVGVGDNEEVQLFYYFVESQRTPAQDPLLLWIPAGPGCSGQIVLFFESGPLLFDYGEYDGSLPTLHDNPFTWTESLNLIYVDAPVGAGYSYSTTQSGYVMDDYKHVAQLYEFLQKWLDAHPTYLKNILYIGGDSYSGMPVPMLAQTIVNGNENGSIPMMNFRGYVIGNPVTDTAVDGNAQIPIAHRLSLISDQLYKSLKTSCHGEYVTVNSSNHACIADLDAFDALTSDINTLHVLEPLCSNGLPTQKEMVLTRRYLKETSSGLQRSRPNGPALWCRSYRSMLNTVWANNKGVQDALGVRRGTKRLWQHCNTTLDYTEDVTSVIIYHQSLSKMADLRVLIYSGDHDMQVPHIGTQRWISTLNLTEDESWRTWSVDGQTAGYTKKLINEYITLTYATVKGGGHIAAETKVKECAAMVNRWMAYFPL